MFGVFACAPEQLTERELLEYIGDEGNGLSKSVTVNGAKVSVTLKPTDLLVLQELDGKSTQENIDSLRMHYARFCYFVVSLSQNDRELLHEMNGMEQYSEMVNVLSFRMGQYVSLTTSATDTIPVNDYALNRTFGMAPSTDLLFVFDRESVIGKEWVQLNLNEFGMGLGNQRFRFETAELLDVPQLKFSLTE